MLIAVDDVKWLWTELEQRFKMEVTKAMRESKPSTWEFFDSLLFVLSEEELNQYLVASTEQ